jgi:hypothetical protein
VSAMAQLHAEREEEYDPGGDWEPDGNVACDYCGDPAMLATGEQIYPHRPDHAHLVFWRCVPCDAYVGCHKNSNAKPLGRLANKELRAWKQRAHAAFDPYWKSGRLKRGDAYARLAKTLGIPQSECHIGMFDVAMCKRVVAIIERRSCP